VWNLLLEAKRNFPRGFPSVHPADMAITDEKAKKLVSRIQSLEYRISKSPLSQLTDAKRLEYLELYKKKLDLRLQLKQMRDESKKSLLSKFRGELKNRERILRRFGHINSDGVVLQKGRVACETESVDELVITELIFEGLFNELNAAQAVALLTCLFDVEKTTKEDPLDTALVPAYDRLIKTAHQVAQTSNECQIPIDEELYVNGFRSALMNVAYNWAKGKPFTEVVKMTTMFEGSIIRIFRRLEEMLRQLLDAADAIGNQALKDKFDEGMKLIKRGIMFTGSLYI